MDFSKINKLSLCSFVTEVYFNELCLSKATSFVYSYKGGKYLITNYHVTSGRDAYTGDCLHKNCAILNRLVVSYYENKNL